MMHRKSALFLLAMVISGFAFSQVKISGRIGGGLSTIAVDDDSVDVGPLPSFSMGALAEYKFFRGWYAAGGVQLSYRSFNATQGKDESQFSFKVSSKANLISADFPLVLGYSQKVEENRIQLLGGPIFSVLMYGDNTYRTESNYKRKLADGSDSVVIKEVSEAIRFDNPPENHEGTQLHLKQLDLGFHYGLNYIVGDNFYFGFTHWLGLQNLQKQQGANKVLTRNFQVHIGFYLLTDMKKTPDPVE